MVVAPSGTVTFIFTDVVGSTALWEADRSAMAEGLRGHDVVVSEVIDETDGYLFFSAGDSFGISYADAQIAVGAALSIRSRLAELGPGALGVRIGVNTGVAVERDGDYFGPVVNRCARIMSLGGAGDILLSAATAELIEGVELFDLGRHELRGVDELQRVFGIRRVDGVPPSLPAVAKAIVAGETDLFGRDADLGRLRRLLRQHRLVSLVGAGGVGKTALARRVATELTMEFEDGALWCDLSPIDGEAFIQAVAAAIGLAVESPQIADVVASLRHRHVLVALDNCEHVIAETASLAAAVMSGCAGVTMLCTSREALRLRQEVTVPVELLQQDAAIELFAARAARTNPEGGPDPEQIAMICERIEGLPLALELAASRLSTMTITDLDERLSDGLTVLRTGARDVPDRHRTLRDCIEWSWRTLTQVEQAVLSACAVFVDGVTLGSAQAVALRLGYEPDEVEAALEVLVERSLVVLRGGVDGRARYHMLDSIRTFGLEHLDLPARAEATTAFVDAMVSASASIGELLDSSAEELGLARFFEELSNMRAAARLVFATDESPQRMFRLALPVSPDGLTVAHSVEPIDWLAGAIDRWGIVDDPLTAAALLVVGALRVLGGDRDQGRLLIVEGHRRQQLPGSEPSRQSSTAAMAGLEWTSSNYALAIKLARSAVAEARALDPGPTRAIALATLLNWLGPEAPDVEEVVRESHDVAYATGVPTLIALHHLAIGIAATGARRDDQALSELRSAFEVASRANLPLVNLVHRQLLLLHGLRGENHPAATHGALAIEGLLSAGAVYTAWVAVRFSTLVLAGSGYADEALMLDAACAASPTTSRRLPVERQVWQTLLEAIVSSVKDADAATRAGRALSEQEAFELALEVLRDISAN